MQTKEGIIKEFLSHWGYKTPTLVLNCVTRELPANSKLHSTVEELRNDLEKLLTSLADK